MARIEIDTYKTKDQEVYTYHETDTHPDRHSSTVRKNGYGRTYTVPGSQYIRIENLGEKLFVKEALMNRTDRQAINRFVDFAASTDFKYDSSLREISVVLEVNGVQEIHTESRGSALEPLEDNAVLAALERAKEATARRQAAVAIISIAMLVIGAIAFIGSHKNPVQTQSVAVPASPVAPEETHPQGGTPPSFHYEPTGRGGEVRRAEGPGPAYQAPPSPAPTPAVQASHLMHTLVCQASGGNATFDLDMTAMTFKMEGLSETFQLMTTQPTYYQTDARTVMYNNVRKTFRFSINRQTGAVTVESTTLSGTKTNTLTCTKTR